MFPGVGKLGSIFVRNIILPRTNLMVLLHECQNIVNVENFAAKINKLNFVVQFAHCGVRLMRCVSVLNFDVQEMTLMFLLKHSIVMTYHYAWHSCTTHFLTEFGIIIYFLQKLLTAFISTLFVLDASAAYTSIIKTAENRSESHELYYAM